MSHLDISVPPGLLRRLGALIYDWLLIIALWFLQSALLLFFTHGEALPEDGWAHWAYVVMLYGTALGFFVFFWHKNGQTLGMRAWRLRLVDTSGQAPTTGKLLRRALWAIPSWGLLGLGVLMLYVDPQRRALQDRMSATYLVVETLK
ncbi:MAG: RDD family protein [Halothiobacillaceae bacterium]